MKIGFFWQGGDSPIAGHMIASAKSVMPDVEIWHLTDGATRKVEGADGIKRIYEDMPMAVRRMRHHGSCEGDWLFVDTDIIFTKDVRDVFDEPFDIAVTDRIGTNMEGSEYAKFMPYNMGVTFSRNPAFWNDVADQLSSLSAQWQEWAGDQLIVCEWAERSNYDVVVLPGRQYNYPPLNEKDTEAAILHYKGRRKQWLNMRMKEA